MFRIRVPKIPAKATIPFVCLGIITALYLSGHEVKYVFASMVVLTYVLLFPRKLFNPKNFVFGFYFVWYCLGPICAERYAHMYERFGTERVNTAFVYCFATYAFAMFTLEWFLNDLDKGQKITTSTKFYDKKDKRHEQIERKCGELRLSITAFTVLCVLFAVGLLIYISRTGGIGAWLTSANDAFFNRGGSGFFYIMFTQSLLLLLYFEGQKAVIGVLGYARRFLYIGLLAVSYVFIGSRSTTFMAILVLFADRIIKLDTFNRKSIIIIISGIAIFVIGMVVRLDDLILSNVSYSVNRILNYFDTFENLLIMMRDFSPGFMRTFLLPLNWPLAKLGISVFAPYYDMSIWLTTVYYPDSWLNGGTTQWPLEADMYMSFFFWGGIPVVIAYFVIIAYIYRKAQDKGVWQYIYIIEGFYIISHLRGGFLIYWYYWLIPIYIWLLKKYKKKDNTIIVQGEIEAGQGNIV